MGEKEGEETRTGMEDRKKRRGTEARQQETSEKDQNRKHHLDSLSATDINRQRKQHRERQLKHPERSSDALTVREES